MSINIRQHKTYRKIHTQDKTVKQKQNKKKQIVIEGAEIGDRKSKRKKAKKIRKYKDLTI
jgi:hypothetical protein